MSSIYLRALHRGVSYNISLLPDDTLSVLHAHLESLTSVPAARQKLLYKGKRPTHTHETTIQDAGLTNGIKITMLGSTDQELGNMVKVENEQKRRAHVMQERASKGTVKMRSTGIAKPNTFIFHKLEPLPHLPDPASALNILQRLSSDPAINRVMLTHQLSVGLLTELAPHEHPELLGLNVNAGQAIKLRLRTNQYDGFRSYSETRRVLCHELAHNVWGDHENNFKELNSKLNREVLEFEQRVRDGTHTLASEGSVYEPSPTGLEVEAQAHVLGDRDLPLGRMNQSTNVAGEYLKQPRVASKKKSRRSRTVVGLRRETVIIALTGTAPFSSVRDVEGMFTPE
ncbi:WLM-domain-containing protein [Russula dissimulans]|nr:WLM-domain-containing protein [Russula dissimulans]